MTYETIQAFGLYIVIPICVSIVIVNLVDVYVKREARNTKGCDHG